MTLYKTLPDAEVDRVLEVLRQKISQVAGVTLNGNRLTVRWNMDGELVDVHMIVESVTTPTESSEHMEKVRRHEDLLNKYKRKFPELGGELFYAENGYWQK